jgi:Putative phage replication protein RstA
MDHREEVVGRRTPPADRGVQMSAAVHWLRGTCDLDEESVLAALSEICGGLSFEVLPSGRYQYGRRVRSVEGLTVLSEPFDPETMPAVCVEVPGAACEFLGAEKLRAIAGLLKLTRVDFAWDGVPFTVGEMRSWVEARQMRTRLSKATAHEALGPRRPGRDGDSVTLGSREGSAQLCVYDRRGPVRAELRLYGDRAAHAGSVLALPVSEWSRAFLGLLRGVVDFVDRSQAVRGEDCPLLPSWAQFVAGAARVVVKLAGAAAPSLERAREWVMTQVSKTLHMLTVAGVRMEEVLERGRTRMRRSDELRLSAWLGARAVTAS